MMTFMKKIVTKYGFTTSPEVLAIKKRKQLEIDVKKGSEEAVKRYKGVLQKLAEYDRI